MKIEIYHYDFLMEKDKRGKLVHKPKHYVHKKTGEIVKIQYGKGSFKIIK